MANYAILKANIQDTIKQNGNNDITGELMQSTLLAMISSLGAGYQFMGVAVPATNPGTPDYRAFWLAGPGIYTNFNTITVPDGYIGILMYDNAWHLSTIQAGGSSPGGGIVVVDGIDEMDTNTVAALQLGTFVVDIVDVVDVIYQVSLVDDTVERKELTHINGNYVRRISYIYNPDPEGGPVGWTMVSDKNWVLPEKDIYITDFPELIDEISGAKVGIKVFVGDDVSYDCYTVVKRDEGLVVMTYVDATKIVEARYTYDDVNEEWSVNVTTKVLN